MTNITHDTSPPSGASNTTGSNGERDAALHARRERFAQRFASLCAEISEARDRETYPFYPVLREGEVNFSGNNYLGLSRDPRVIAAAQNAIAEHGTSSCASPLVGGSTDLHVGLQADLADFLGTQQVQLVHSGYQTNLSVIAGLLQPDGLRQPEGILVCDQLIHASVIDGGWQARAEIRLFRHNSPDHLQSVLAAQPAGRPILVAVEGVYSADGDLGRIAEICDVAHRHDALVLVDEAHSVGVIGPDGRGVAHHAGVAGEVDLLVGTLSKSLGSTGGFIAGDEALIEIIRHRARALIFSVAPSPASVGAARCALQILRSEPQHRKRLWANTHAMRHGLRAYGFDTMDSQSPVIPVLIGDPRRARALATALQHAGIHATAGVPPMVAPNRSRLRIHVTAAHSLDQINHAIRTLHAITQAEAG